MIKFVKIPLEAIQWDNNKLESFVNDKTNLVERSSNLVSDGMCYIPKHYLKGNLKSVIHKAFLYLKPEYRKANNWPHALSELSDCIIAKYD